MVSGCGSLRRTPGLAREEEEEDSGGGGNGARVVVEPEWRRGSHY